MTLVPVGVAGCGRMGAPMLAALLHGGLEARGYDLRGPAEFGELAPHMTSEPQIFAENLRTLITVVRDIPQTEDVLFDKGLAQTPSLRYLIVSSTLSPRYIQDLIPRLPPHVTLIDAPMSGAAIAAQERRLSFMLGGPDDTLDTLHSVFQAMGAHFHRMGPTGAGMQAKVLNNLLAASSTAMTRLVLDWAETAGLDQDAMLALMHTSSGQNWFASHFTEIEFARDGLSVDNSIGILVKDVESALDAAPEQADTALPRAVQQAIAALKPMK